MQASLKARRGPETIAFNIVGMQEGAESIEVLPRFLVQSEMRAGQVEFEKVDHGPADTVQSDIHF